MKTKEEYFAEFDQQTKTHSILLYAKGTKEFPRCGFSAQTIEILKSYAKPFEVIDVLSDLIRKEYLKEYSDWPTIPQLYIKSELVGGFDITLELHKSGQLKELIDSAV
ncbi:MAG: Grx4 family monothiol glutaredoxin [Candidatus Caenarcaniphilales bacterium]|nr:Grx4 family monothiol glutaredoxin [Candidatus Caenarcaniphilales bacterium]